MRSLLKSAAFLILLLVPFSVQASNLEDMNAAFGRCVATFPNVKAIRKAHTGAGMRAEGNQSGFYFHTLNGRRVLVGTSDGTKLKRCVFGVKKMRGQVVIDVAQKLVGKHFGSSAKRLKLNANARFIAAWAVRINGVKSIVGVMKNINFNPLYRGSLIMVATLK